MTRIRPGTVALFLIIIMAFSLGISINKEATILEKAYDQVVVVAPACGGGYGTGWFLDHNHVITANHVVEMCDQVRLVRYPWSSNGTVVARDPGLDVALIEVESPPSWARGLPLASRLSIGDDVYVVGYPIQLYEEVGEDLVEMSKIPRVQKASVTWINPEKRIFEFSPGTDAGNSGGPIVSVENGGIAGIVVYARPGVVNEGYYGLRMDGLAEFLEEHGVDYEVAPGHSWLPYLGLGLVALLGFLVLFGKKGVGRVWS